MVSSEDPQTWNRGTETESGCGIWPQTAEREKKKKQAAERLSGEAAGFSFSAKCSLILKVSGFPQKGENSLSVISKLLETQSIYTPFQQVLFGVFSFHCWSTSKEIKRKGSQTFGISENRILLQRMSERKSLKRLKESKKNNMHVRFPISCSFKITNVKKQMNFKWNKWPTDLWGEGSLKNETFNKRSKKRIYIMCDWTTICSSAGTNKSINWWNKAFRSMEGVVICIFLPGIYPQQESTVLFFFFFNTAFIT